MSEKKGDIGKILSGMPIAVPNSNIAITQPTLRDVSAFGEDEFLIDVQILLNIRKMVIKNNEDEGNSLLSTLEDFHLLMMALSQDLSLRLTISNFLDFIFPNYIVDVQDSLIIFKIEEDGKNKKVGQLNPMNFEDFQYCLKTLFLPRGMDGAENIEYKPANDAARAIAEKLKRGNEIRQKIKDKERGGEESRSLIGNYTSVLSIGLGIDINVLYGYTLFQLYDAFTRYMNKMQYDLYMRVSTMPMMDTSKMTEPEHWIENIYK